MSRIKFMNIHIDNLSMDEALDKISFLVENTKRSYVVMSNVDHLVKLDKDREFFQAYQSASLILTDGKPLLWISKLLKTPIKEKVSGPDLFPRLCEMAAKKGYTLFFLGAAEGVADTAANILAGKYPGLNVVGTCSPYFGFENDPHELEKIIHQIKTLSPDILIVALGTLKQEKFILRYKDQLDVPVSLALGACLDFESGNIRRAPAWMSNCGLEWFYRLCREPRRLFRRYIIEDMRIFRLVLKHIAHRI